MRKGKIAAQVAHASMKVFFDRGKIDWTTWNEVDGIQVTPKKSAFIIRDITEAMREWMEYGPFTKIVVGCDSEEEMLAIKAKADEAGIPTALITDSGKTEFNGVPTNTCVAIGPDESEKIDLVTGHLKLL